MNFTILGKPQPQERPMFHHYHVAMDRPASRKAKKLVAQLAILARQTSADQFLGPENEQDVIIHLKFFGAHGKADLDNLYKLVTDALQGVLYKNDNQIVKATMEKLVCEKGQKRTEVEINISDAEPICAR